MKEYTTGILLQGDIRSLTLPIIEECQQNFPNSEIILSTWDDQDISNIPKYIADTAESTIQSRKKNKYCYVGKDRGYRSCVKIDDNDICQSNKIYHSKERCVNPRLRL